LTYHRKVIHTKVITSTVAI